MSVTSGVILNKLLIFSSNESAEVQIWRMGKNCPKIQCSMMSAVFSTFGAKSKIALTVVRSRVRKSPSHNDLYTTFTFIFLVTFINVRVYRCFPTINIRISKIVIHSKLQEPTFN